MQEQPIQRYKVADYFGVSFVRLVETANTPEVSVDYVIRTTAAENRRTIVSPVAGRSCLRRWDDRVSGGGTIV